MKAHHEGHEFAVYFPSVSTMKVGEYTIDDAALHHRITRVLRLNVDERLILFDRDIRLLVHIQSIDRKTITIRIIEKKDNAHLAPMIHFLLPLLKKEALEDAVYGLVEAGVTNIHLVTTQKTHHKWSGQKEKERLERIIIAAAEQSKCYRFALLHEPVPLQEAVARQEGIKLFFDAQGHSFLETMQPFFSKSIESLSLLIGPEGDLTAQEKELIQDNNFSFVSLTPTILRAFQAASATAVMMRSLFR